MPSVADEIKSKKSKTNNDADRKSKKDSDRKSKKDADSKPQKDADRKSKKDSDKKSKKDSDKKSDKKSKKRAVQEEEEPQKKQKVDDQIISENLKLESIVQEEEESKKVDDPTLLENFKLEPCIRNALKETGVNSLFPIQIASFEPVMQGKDVLGRARTGTGKTLAFSLPIVQKLHQSISKVRGRAPKTLIMAPTRELAIQVYKQVQVLSTNQLKVTCVYGGVPYDSQYTAFRDGVDIVVGTPGRLIDHIDRGNLKLFNLEFIVLDEADQMLDIGFAEAMEKVLMAVKDQKKDSESPSHQTLLFSATLPSWIQEAVKKFMKSDKVTLDLIGKDKQKTSKTVSHIAIPSRWQNRASVLGDILAVYGRGTSGRSIIFVETKGEGNELGLNEKLVAAGCQVIHGDVPQKQREVSMQGFRDGKFKCLICTNVCARGVDIPEVDLVINCEPPTDVDTYVHRSGRTGRAGKSGVCVTFFKQQQEYALNQISIRAGVEFTRMGAPQPKEIVSARAQDTLNVIKEELDPVVLSYFTDTAESILAHYNNDPVTALSSTIALICNTVKKLPSRSLMTANEGFLTVLFRVPSPIRNVGYIRSMTQQTFPLLTYEDTIGWRMTADSKGVVVDIKEEKIEILEDSSIKIAGVLFTQSRGITAEIPKELPELQERLDPSQNSNFRNNSGNRNSSWNSNSRNSYGNRNGNNSYGNRNGNNSYGNRNGNNSYGNRNGNNSYNRNNY